MCNLGMERKLISELERALPDGIIKIRIVYLLNWYHKKAVYYKLITYVATALSILLPAALTLLNTEVGESLIGKEWTGQLRVILPVLNSAGAGFYAFFQSRLNWIRYRRTIESLKRETILYINSCSTDTDAKEFLLKIEDICAAEVLEWENIRKDIPDQDRKQVTSDQGTE